MTRKDILDTALTCVNGDRQSDYGTPERSFETIAGFWNGYLSRVDGDLTGKDVAAMLILLKVARIAGGKKKDDNWVDIAGYAACGGEIESAAKLSELAMNVTAEVFDHMN